jgi:SSS family solute:Na+ symporter
MSIGIANVLGIILIILLIIGVGIYSGSRVKSASDFSTGGGAGTLMVCGAIMGSLVSGQATIGTAQLAFTYGLSAWWFTLGAGIGCCILAIGYVIPLRKSGDMTLMQIIGDEYGKKAEYIGSVLCSIGIFISVIAQVIASAALLMTIFQMDLWVACIVSALVMAAYVIFGGAWGAGMGGIVKLLLLYTSCIMAFIVVIIQCGSLTGLYDSVQKIFMETPLGNLAGLTDATAIQDRYLNLVARGTLKDVGSGLSLILGVLSTQTYAQAIWSGKKDSQARKGAMLAALLIPPIGIACTMVGLYMRGHYITTSEIAALQSAGQSIPEGLTQIASTAQAFPVFATTYMPKFVGGIVLGTLLITVVGGGAGLSHGMATIVVNDILVKLSNRFQKAKANLIATRSTIVLILAMAVLISIVVPGAVINDFGFLSMGIRGTVVFIPLSAALFLPGDIDYRFIITASIFGPVAVLLGKALCLPFDSLFLGLFICLFVVAIGGLVKVTKKESFRENI